MVKYLYVLHLQFDSSILAVYNGVLNCNYMHYNALSKITHVHLSYQMPFIA